MEKSGVRKKSGVLRGLGLGVMWTGFAAVMLSTVLFIIVSIDRKRKRQSWRESLNQRALFATSPLNLYYHKQSLDQTTPIIDISDRKQLILDLLQNWRAIRNEGLAASRAMSPIKGDMFFGDKVIKDDKWRKLYIKWYGDTDPSTRALCPVTCQVVDRNPEIHLAMFSLLKSGGRIEPHAGPFRGAIRVHLGLDTPNSPSCYIKIGDETYYWRDGEVVAFDDTYRHEVRNDSNKDRLILFMDIERKMKSQIATTLNKYLIRKVAPISTRANNKIENVVFN